MGVGEVRIEIEGPVECLLRTIVVPFPVQFEKGSGQVSLRTSRSAVNAFTSARSTELRVSVGFMYTSTLSKSSSLGTASSLDKLDRASSGKGVPGRWPGTKGPSYS